MPPGSYIGAARNPQDPKTIVYNQAEVVFIPGSERRRFLSEYEGALASKSLVVRSKEDFEAYNAQLEKADAEALKERLKKNETPTDKPAEQGS